MWTIKWTPQMIQVLKILNYYWLINCADFSIGVFNSAKFLNFENIPIQEDLAKWLRYLRIPNIWEELHKAFRQKF